MHRRQCRFLWFVAVIVALTEKKHVGLNMCPHSSLLALALSTSSPQQNKQSNNDVMNRRESIQQASACVSATTFGAGLTIGPYQSLAKDATAPSSTTISPVATLSDGSKFPLVSFGLQIYDDNMAYKLTLTALECGYRNFFASVLAGNQKGFAKAIRDSNIPRNELYICGSVVSNRVTGLEAAREETTKGWKRNLEAMAAGNIDYLDQIMLDYPGTNHLDRVGIVWGILMKKEYALSD
jgi:hypothetical protein